MAINAPDSSGKTPLHLVADEFGAKHIGLLLHHGADMGARDRDGFSPANIAVSKGNFECVRALIKAGFDMRTKGQFDRTILHVGCTA